MQFQYNDGGRAAAGYRGEASDCVTRAIAIATNQPYQDVYDMINSLATCERSGRRAGRKSSARTGVKRVTWQRYLERLGWKWTPTMQIGQGCKIHLKEGELPHGRLIVRVSRHMAAVIDSVIHDTHNPSREGTRCVYGYWSPPQKLDRRREVVTNGPNVVSETPKRM